MARVWQEAEARTCDDPHNTGRINRLSRELNMTKTMLTGKENVL